MLIGGFIIWELSGDIMNDLSTPLLDVVNKKLSDPSYSCGKSGILPDGGIDLPHDETQAPLAASISTVDPSVASQPLDNFPTSGNETPAPQAPSPSSTSEGDPNTLNHTSFLFGEIGGELSSSSVDHGATIPSFGSSVDHSNATIPPLVHESTEFVIPNTSPSDNSQPAIDNLFPPTPSIKVEHPLESHQKPSDGPLLLKCDESMFSLSETKLLDVSYQYELHRYKATAALDAAFDAKNAMLANVLGELKCLGSMDQHRSHLRRRAFRRDRVVAVTSHRVDSDSGASCGIEVAAPDLATECESLIGLFTFHVKNDTSEESMSEIKDKMLSMLRQGMEAGRYESDAVWKMTFVESAAANELSLSLGTANSEGSTSQQPAGSTGQQPNNPALPITIGFVVAMLFAAIVFALLIVHKQKKPKHLEPSDTPSLRSSHGSTEWTVRDDQEDQSKDVESTSSLQGEEPITNGNDNTDAAKVDDIAACDVSVEEIEQEKANESFEEERLQAERLLEAEGLEKEELEKELEQERIKAEERLEQERHASARLLLETESEKEELEKDLEQERERLKMERLEAEQLLETERLKVVNK